MSKYIYLFLFILFPLLYEEVEINKKSNESKIHNFEIRIRKQNFTYIPSELGNDSFYLRSEIKNNRLATFIPDVQYFNNRFKFLYNFN